MAYYIAPAYAQWVATQIAGQALTIGLHTDAPGNDGTGSRANSNAGTPGVEKVVAANAIAAADGVADNDADIEVFTPNATSAGQAISHVSYKFGATFIGWASLAAAVTTVEDVPFVLAAGTVDLSVAAIPQV